MCAVTHASRCVLGSSANSPLHVSYYAVCGEGQCNDAVLCAKVFVFLVQHCHIECIVSYCMLTCLFTHVTTLSVWSIHRICSPFLVASIITTAQIVKYICTYM